MNSLLFQHPVEWWNTLSSEGRLALVAVALGLLTIILATWVGLRRWWQRWKREQTNEP
jgi:hypothetical protein